MTSKQKRIVGILAIANAVVILVVVTLTTRPTPSSNTHTPTPTHPPRSTLPPGDCQWQATQLLAQAGLGGTVTLTADHSLDFAITYPFAPDQTVDDAAQSVWTAFDIALILQEQDCPTFTQIQVTILAHNSQISASVGTSDLMALGTGELGEDEFIERVIYGISQVRNE